jgi:hypothetical protein
MLILFVLLITVILTSCVFSGSETGFISWNPLKVAHAASKGNFTARLAMRFVNNRGQFLSTVLIGNNICNISAALLFVALYEEIDKAVALDLSRVPLPETLFLTPVLLLFSEILPKSLYRTYPFKMTMKSVPFLAVIFFALSPFFRAFGAVPKIFWGASADGPDPRNANVREEIVLVAVEGAKRGTIFEGADRIMKNTLEMKGKRIGSLSVGLDEWKKTRTVYTASQMVSAFGKDAGAAGVLADEAVVFDDAAKAPAGYVPLLEAAACRASGEIGGMKTLGSLMKPLPRLRSGMDVLACLRRMPPDSPRYHLVYDGDNVVGVLDKMALFGAAFAKSGD